jgi:hypothetical protein
MGGPPISHSGGRNEHISRTHLLLHRVEHLPSRANIHTLNTPGCRQ